MQITTQGILILTYYFASYNVEDHGKANSKKTIKHNNITIEKNSIPDHQFGFRRQHSP